MNRGSAFDPIPHAPILPRFNEAPIHESGKSWVWYEDEDADGGASMRPRFMNRGSSNGGVRSGRLTSSFNEAPIHESGKYRGPE